MPCAKCGRAMTVREAKGDGPLCECDDSVYVESDPTPQENQTTLITAPRRPLNLLPAPDTPLPMCPTNIPATTFAGKALLLKASGPGDLDVEPGKPLRMRAVHWALIPGEAVDEQTGEVSQVVRTVLVGDDGRTFRSSSAHLPSRILAASMMFSDEEWSAGIPLIIETKKGRRGRMYHDVNVDTAPEPKKKGK